MRTQASNRRSEPSSGAFVLGVATAALIGLLQLGAVAHAQEPPLVEAAPTEPVPVQPAPVQPAPVQPAPVQPAPAQPVQEADRDRGPSIEVLARLARSIVKVRKGDVSGERLRLSIVTPCPYVVRTRERIG